MTTTHDILSSDAPHDDDHQEGANFITDTEGITATRDQMPDAFAAPIGQAAVGQLASPTESGPVSAPATEKRSHRGRIIGAVSGLVALGAAIFIATEASGSSDEHGKTNTPAAVSTPKAGQKTTPSPEASKNSPTAVATGEHQTKYGKVDANGKYLGFDFTEAEWVPLKYQPTPMTGSTPQELFPQFMNNYLGLYQDGATPYGQFQNKAEQNTLSPLQELYIANLGGAKNIQTDKLKVMNNGVLNADEHNTVSLKMIDSAEGDGSIVIQAHYHATHTGEGISTPTMLDENQTFHFVRTTAGQAGIPDVAPDTQVWVLDEPQA